VSKHQNEPCRGGKGAVVKCCRIVPVQARALTLLTAAVSLCVCIAWAHVSAGGAVPLGHIFKLKGGKEI
jgi:hypothetical protein